MGIKIRNKVLLWSFGRATMGLQRGNCKTNQVAKWDGGGEECDALQLNNLRTSAAPWVPCHVMLLE